MINNRIIKKCLNLDIPGYVAFDHLDLVNTSRENVLSFIDQVQFLDKLKSNKGISGVFVNKQLAGKITSKKIHKIVCDDPRYCFYTLYNFMAEKNHKKFVSRIDKSAKIDKRAVVSPHNVVIGKNVIIEPNVMIYPDVYIGDNCIVRAGCALGCDIYEYKKTKFGLLSVTHDGKLIIKDNVYIGNNCTVYKGFSFQDTIIGQNTKIDNLVEIAHSVVIGKDCFIIGHSMICGSVTIGDDVWIGANVTVSNQIIIENGCKISLGSIVTKNVSKNKRVSGNFAIDHDKFIKFIKSIK